MMRVSVIALFGACALAAPASFLGARNESCFSDVTSWSSGNMATDVGHGVCAPLTVIFARGSGEHGNIGKSVGPPLFTALLDLYGTSIAFQGVDYNATWHANAELGHEGGQIMADLIHQAKFQCPFTSIVIAGYSQGAMVLHSAMKKKIVKVHDVAAAVAFGDPFKGRKLKKLPEEHFKEFCGEGDNLCAHRHFRENVTTHRHYGVTAAPEAAQWLLDNITLFNCSTDLFSPPKT